MKTKRYIWKDNNGKDIYLYAPTWDCWWYWGFWYLWNDNCHYHIDRVWKDKNLNIYDGIREHFTDLQIQEEKLWLFCELFMTAYTLKETAEVFGRWWSNYSYNPVWEMIKDELIVSKINNKLLPTIFIEIEKCFV